MKAILVNQYGSAEQLQMGEFADPQAKEDELLVKIKATALNRADILQREGKYPPPKGTSPILGLEMAGVVEGMGSNCSGWHIGDRVCALLPGGGYAEYISIPAKMGIPIPENLSFEAAAAIPEVFLTAYQTLFWLGDLKSQQYVLIHAGASGVGTAAIQLAREAGAIVIVTASSAKKLDACVKLGARIAINYRDGEFSSSVLDETDQEGVHLIIDCIGAPYWKQNISSLRTDGRLVLLALMGGAKVEQINLGMLLSKRLHISGTTLRDRDNAYKTKLTSEFVKNILPGFAEGCYKPVIDSVFSWENVAEAHQYMEKNHNIGKLILHIED